MTDDAFRTALRRLATRPQPPRPWHDGHKIPWHDPDFGRRMLKVHLDPETDMASRAPDVIGAHVNWLLELLSAEPEPMGRPRHLLDLGCGPGLYAVPLARAGFQVTGIDINPAAIEHAHALALEAGVAERVSFLVADLADQPERLFADLDPVDAVTFWSGEIASFTPDTARDLLAAAATATCSGGLLVLENIPGEMFVHDSETSWELLEQSVFSDTPHLWLQEHAWDDEARAEITVHWIRDIASGDLKRYAQCHQAYSNEELEALLATAAWSEITTHPAITGVDESLEFPVVVARREGGMV